jgi:hypothetical protein
LYPSLFVPIRATSPALHILLSPYVEITK